MALSDRPGPRLENLGASPSTTLDQLVSAPARVGDERAERLAAAARALRFHIAFLDDALRGILPHDLILIGAQTGAGKTELATAIAKANASAKKPVAFFALEAEPKEIERRLKYGLIAELAARAKDQRAAELTYPDWMFGLVDDITAPYELAADRLMLERFSSLHTFYRGERFGSEQVPKLFAAAKSLRVQLIVLDHAHVLDLDPDATENRAFKEMVMLIRDTSLRVGIPVVLVAHLRKRDTRARRVVPDFEEFHGSSDLAKIATQIVTLSPAVDIDAQWYQAPTFISVPKDRRGGALRQVALAMFDTRARAYAATYTLGHLADGGTRWEPLPALATAPRWAKQHRALEAT